MYTLGINAVFHDPSASLVWDGEVLAAAEEERFNHVKHGKRPGPFSTYELPFQAIDYCLRAAGIRLADVDHVAYSFDPYQLLGSHQVGAAISLPVAPSAHPTKSAWESPWEPLFLCYVLNAPRQLAGGAPHHLKERFPEVHADGPYRWHFVDHHLTHAVSAYHASPFEQAAVLTVDGRGERATTSYSIGDGNRLDRLGQVDVPHSLGILYEQVTEYLGFQRSSDEYKVMALTSFGKQRFLREFQEIICVQGEGRYTVQPPELEARFGPPRQRHAPIEARHHDVAASLQVALEETVLELARWLHGATRSDSLCLAGGVALNCVMNSCLRDRGPFSRLWVQPAAGDAGTSLGAALWVDARERGSESRHFRMDHAFLGPAYSDQDIERVLRWSKSSYRRMDDVAQEVAALLAVGNVVGWFQGRMEFGPRALGARSILASPIDASMQDRLNDIKDREDFRPVAPVVLEQEASRWFERAETSPFMLFVYPVRPDVAGRIPAVRHVDGTARIQTINRSQHPLFYDLVKAFRARTGVPVLINTSFNTRSEPIVCSPEDALRSFWSSPLDALAIGPFLVAKPAVDA
ncbi:MAG: carbamoyltransferase [Chloroflexi bacterium]|nr:carbamoyltransferase [Chloroflexota bacterium]